ncbi:MAG: hypothetical protein H0U74_17210 [Bradymonadaceae bacterium]|nr:hypothetical protein [Lujinxingiaceae bacterium]
MKPMTHISAALALLATALLFGCAKQNAPTTIIVPSAATSAPEYRGDGSVPVQRYVVRMSDGERDWEIEFPEVATGYEVRIPLKNTPGLASETHKLTSADKQLLEHMRRTNPDMEREGVYHRGRNVNDQTGRNQHGGVEPGAELDADGNQVANPGPADPMGNLESRPAPTRPSYLLGTEEVQKLFRGGNHELAMVKIADLEKAYPNDVRILSMKGTLWMKLGRPELARETWEQVLQIDPDNRQVIDALKGLDR